MQQNQLTATIQRLIQDEELSPIFDGMIKEAGASTQAGYKLVLNQFINSEAATSKIEQWEKDAAEESRMPRRLSCQTAHRSIVREGDEDAADKPTPRLNLTSALHRLARSPVVRSLSLDCSDKSDPAPIEPPKQLHEPVSRQTSIESTSSTLHRMGSSLSSLRESIGSITINMNLKEELEPSFMESLSSMNITFIPEDREEPKWDGPPRCISLDIEDKQEPKKVGRPRRRISFDSFNLQDELKSKGDQWPKRSISLNNEDKPEPKKLGRPRRRATLEDELRSNLDVQPKKSISLNTEDKPKPKRGGRPRRSATLEDELRPNLDGRLRRRACLNDPLRSSWYHAGVVSQIQCLEKKIDMECEEWW